MELGESIYESAVREFQEETNLTPKNVHLKGAIRDLRNAVDEIERILGVEF